LNPGLELLSFQEAVLIRVDQASDPTADAPDQSREPLRRAHPLLAVTAGATLVLATHPLGVREESAHVPPDRLIKEVGPALLVIADALAAEAVRIGADATIVSIFA
jgi:hypothetical protein